MKDQEESIESFGATLAAALEDNPELRADLISKGLIRPSTPRVEQ